jgi:hypothetical protein
MRGQNTGPGFLRARFLPFLFALLWLSGEASLGYSQPLVRLVPDPLWLQSGNEIREGFLICPYWKSSVGVKYLAQEELLDLLRLRTEDPALFGSGSFRTNFAAFLVSVSNNSPETMLLGGEFATLRDEKGRELEWLDLADLSIDASEEMVELPKMKALAGLLFFSSILLPGESKQGVLFFGAPRPHVGKVTLRISFGLADRARERLECFFPFTVEAISPKTTSLPPP